MKTLYRGIKLVNQPVNQAV